MSKRKRRTTSAAWIEHGLPAPWMLLYAQWLAQEPTAELTALEGEKAKRSHQPTSLARQAKASALARRRMDRRLIVLLERREDFRSYFEKMRADAQFFAQEQMRGDIAENIAARRAGLRKASDMRVDDEGNPTFGDSIDHRAVERYTHPFVELAFPKKVEREPTPERIVINLTGASEASKRLWLSVLNDEPVNEIEWEIIPNDRLTDGRDD